MFGLVKLPEPDASMVCRDRGSDGWPVGRGARENPHIRSLLRTSRRARLQMHPRHMAHLAAGAGLVLAVDVDVGAGLGGELGPTVDLIADEVFHRHAGADPVPRPEWKPADSADVLLELRSDRSLDGPVGPV